MNAQPPKLFRFLADEFHSESWSLSSARAREISPEDPLLSSYQKAADALAARDFTVGRHGDGPITPDVLAGADVFALVHPCDPHWEHTTSRNPPALTAEEITALLDWVRAGGGLLVITEYEHDKYGDNLNDLLAAAGLRIENGKVSDRSACVPGNPEWIFAQPAPDSPLGYLAAKACFYRAGWCVAEGGAQLDWQASAQAHPAQAGLIGTAQLGAGRVVVVTDSVLFGDERIEEHDHLQLWLNLAHWLSSTYAQNLNTHSSTTLGLIGEHFAPEWPALKQSVDALRLLQQPDGHVEHAQQAGAAQLVDSAIHLLGRIARHFPHQADYLAQLPRDLAAWKTSGFIKPDFGASLELFRPDLHRRDGLAHLVVFPMYTPNASMDTRFEALLIRTPWPDWLDAMERASYRNEKFVPGQLVDYTAGYDSEVAVLFPETISLSARPSNYFGIIFCDRESKRLQSMALRAAKATGLMLFPELECLLNDRTRLEETCALWDLIHDKSHSMGELPFDPFMIRQRAPFWMYGLEELRVDVQAFCEATRLAANGFPFARYVCWAILLDRVFRFPLTGSRVRNYDALGGQLMFAFLHQHDVIILRDNRLIIRWEELPAAMNQLREELRTLYKLGADCSKLAFWISAHDLVAKYVRPSVASHWKAEAITDEADPKQWLKLVDDDEFPLGNFHLNLQRHLKK